MDFTILCLYCKERKPRSEYYRDSSACAGCTTRLDSEREMRQQAKEEKLARKRTKPVTPEQRRAYRFKSKFGISVEDYEAMLSEQGNVCAICSKEEVRKIKGEVISLAVDHCHTTGKVRGLLCGGCNVGIGMLKDDPDLLRAALRYLEG